MNKVKAVLFECPKQFDIVYFKLAIRRDPETISKEKKGGDRALWSASGIIWVEAYHWGWVGAISIPRTYIKNVKVILYPRGSNLSYLSRWKEICYVDCPYS
jgi:hypothetical protein